MIDEKRIEKLNSDFWKLQKMYQEGKLGSLSNFETVTEYIVKELSEIKNKKERDELTKKVSDLNKIYRDDKISFETFEMLKNVLINKIKEVK